MATHEDMESPAAAGGSTPRSRRLDVVYGVVGTALQVGTGVVMLPAVAATLAPAELTFWYVFLTIQTLAILIEFGFTPTLSRNFTYVLSGAGELKAEGVPERNGAFDPALFANLLRASRRVFAAMALVVLLLLGVGGTLYLAALARTTSGVAHLWPAWGVFLLGLLVQTNYNWLGCLTVGADRMRQNYQVFIAARSTQVVLSLVGLYYYPSILTLALAYALSVVVGRVLARRAIEDILRRQAPTSDPRAAWAMVRTIAPTAFRTGLATIGEFFTNRFSLLAVSLALGAAGAAEYAIAMQAMMVLLTVSQIGTALSAPRLAAARLGDDKTALRELYAFCLVASVTMMALGSTALIAVGEPILHLIGSETMLPALPVMILLAAIYTIAVNAHTAMNVIASGNRVPYLRAVLITGAATTLGVILVALVNGGLFAMVAVQGVTQLAFNFWRWPVYAFRETGLSLGALWSNAVAGGRRVVLGHP
jgi:O-antigen/teichoic acid export membrane protein